MRRHTVAAAAITAAVLLQHGPAFARVATVRSSRSARQTTAATQPSPLAISVPGAPAGAAASTTLRPGSSMSLHVTVTNNSTTDRLQVAVTTLDAILQANGAIIPGTTAGAAPGSGASSWLGLGDTVLVLEPGASVDEPITVAVPPEAAGGSVAAVGTRDGDERNADRQPDRAQRHRAQR